MNKKFRKSIFFLLSELFFEFDFEVIANADDEGSICYIFRWQRICACIRSN